MSPSRRLAALLALTLMALPAEAQKTETAARSDIAFARSLADDWGFVDLAEHVITGLDGGRFSDDLKRDLALGIGDIYAVGARSVRRADLRDVYYEKAIEAYDEFIYDYPYAAEKGLAESALVSASTSLGRSLAAKLEDATGDERDELRENLRNVLDRAIGLTGDLIAGLTADEERTETQVRQLYGLLYNRATMLLEMAKNQEDGAFSFQQSQKSFENLVYLAGEDKPWGLRAFIGVGDTYAAQLQWEDAASYYEFVVDFSIPKDQAVWQQIVAENKLTAEDKARRFLFVQLGIGGLIDSMRSSGDVEASVEWALYFHNLWKAEGFSLTPPLGDLALLAAARTFIEVGGQVGGKLLDGEARWFATRQEMVDARIPSREQRSALDLALALADQVNRQNPGNILRVRAQKLMTQIIDRPGVKVSPEILFQAAEGEYNDKNYRGAVEAMKRVLAALEDQEPATRIEYGPKVLFHIGRSLQRLDRNLEASLVFEEAVDNWLGDPEYDPKNAEYFLKTVAAVRRTAKSDPLIQAMFTKAESAVEKLGTAGAADVTYNKADRAYKRKDYEPALQLFLQVPNSASSYEKALVYVGACKYNQGDFPGARKVFEDYLNYAESPDNATVDPARLAKRKEALATAEFYWGLTEFELARAGEGDWKNVLVHLEGYHERFPEQTQFAPAALYRAIVAHLELADLEAATAVHLQMVERFEDSKWTGKASILMHKSLSAKLEDVEGQGDREAAHDLLQRLAVLMKIANRISEPSFKNLRAESRYWMGLESWAEAERVLRRLEQISSGDPERAEDFRKYALPDMGKALLRQQKVQEVADRLRELVDTEKASRETARVFAYALCGWADTREDGTIVEIPGVGKEENFEKGTDTLVQLTNSLEKWEEPWYELKFDLAYSYLKWGDLDGRKRESAADQVRDMASNLGEDFGMIETESVRKRFVWLWDLLK